MARTNRQLINELKNLGYLRDPLVEKAFEKIDRKFFVPEEYEESAYENRPIPIGRNQTTSQPLVVAFMLELLDVHPGEKILEIGAGFGWQTALLAQLTREEGENEYERPLVISLEVVPELFERAKENISRYLEIAKGIVDIKEKDGTKGYEECAPYDRIVVCASVDEILQTWKNQLKIGGKIVAPIRQSIVMIEKRGKNEFRTKEFFGFSFVPLVFSK